MVLRPGERPKSISIPKRNIDYRRDPSLIHRRHLAGPSYRDPRQERQLKVRFDFEADSNPLRDSENYHIISPEDSFIKIDSADQILQPYTLPPSSGTWGCQFLRPFMDAANKILVTYHFDHMNLRWVRMTTRLRPDLPIVQPPASQFTDGPRFYWRSRGSRYVRTKKKVQDINRRRRSTANRLYRGRAGTSGARGTTGEFRGGLR